MSQPDRSTPPRIPPHLRPFVVEQHYDQYTAVDHAVWRYVMRQNLRALAGRAHPGYHRHFFETGMDLEYIPDVKKMNERLPELGWTVVAIDGFIPPSIFMDFQAHGFLPIAQDIRTVEHIGYTPAPDIIHEAAGHAPLLLDETFGRFIRYIGEIGAKAISHREDHEVYEAIRDLSIIKEDPHATADDVIEAERRLEVAVAAVKEVSEATEIARLYWWTVEYGLIGSPDAPRIYGAGLLSSMSEGAECLKDHVQHLPFALRCVDTSYDITNPQPQLYVVESFDQLFEVTRELAETMAFKRGGTNSLQKALKSGRVATMVYDSGLQVSGTIEGLELDDRGEAVFVRFTGPAGLAVGDRELEGHGIETYPDGFGAPIGRVVRWPEGLDQATDADLTRVFNAGLDQATDTDLTRVFNAGLDQATDTDLARRGTTWGTDARFELDSGVVVEGKLESVVRIDGRLRVLRFRDATVRLGDRVLYAAERYDMPIVTSIVSVFSGAADKSRFVVERQASRFKNLRAPSTALELERERLYQAVRDARETSTDAATLARVARQVLPDLERSLPGDWLLRLELLELLTRHSLLPRECARLRSQLETLAEPGPDRALIEKGLALIDEEASQRDGDDVGMEAASA